MCVFMCVLVCVSLAVSGRERDPHRKGGRRETKGKGRSKATLSLCNLAIDVQG